MTSNYKEEISKFFLGEVRDDNETLTRLSRDTSLFEVTPTLAVSPIDSNDVSALIKFVAEKNKIGERLTITARSAGTGRNTADALRSLGCRGTLRGEPGRRRRRRWRTCTRRRRRMPVVGRRAM